MRYELYPCDVCGRKISRGYAIDHWAKTVCARCHKKYGTNWIETIIKIEPEAVDNALAKMDKDKQNG